VGKYVELARRARDRAIAQGDAEMVARQEQNLARGLAEEERYFRARAAEIDNSEAIAQLAELGKRMGENREL
jgi:hypothetical protein